jgi:hypothetical protein
MTISRFWAGTSGLGRRSGILIRGVIGGGNGMVGFLPMLAIGRHLLFLCWGMAVLIRTLTGMRQQRWVLRHVVKFHVGGGGSLCSVRVLW